MISLLQINKAVNATIRGALVDTKFSDVPIIAEDVSEANLKSSVDGTSTSVKRPSIKVQLGKDTTGKFNSCNKERTLNIRVYFFAKDRYKYKIDNLKMEEILGNAFLEDIKVTDTFYMPITEDGVDFDTTDSVLQCSFDLYSVEEIPEKTSDTESDEPMEELELDFEYEGE